MKRAPLSSPKASSGSETGDNGARVKVVDFQVLSFYDKYAGRPDGMTGSEIILIYALGEDGVVREYANGRWTPFPIE